MGSRLTHNPPELYHRWADTRLQIKPFTVSYDKNLVEPKLKVNVINNFLKLRLLFFISKWASTNRPSMMASLVMFSRVEKPHLWVFCYGLCNLFFYSIDYLILNVYVTLLLHLVSGWSVVWPTLNDSTIKDDDDKGKR